MADIEQAKGSNARIVLDFETTFGQNPATANGIEIPYNTYAVSAKQNLIDSKTIVSHGNPTEPVYGRITVDGKATFPFCYRTIGYLLKLLMGAPTTTGTSPGPYTHVFKIQKDRPMPSAVIEKGFTDMGQYFLQNGIKIGSLSFQFGEDSEPELSCDTIMGAKETPATTEYDATPTAVIKDVVGSFQASLKEGGSAIATVLSGNVSINRNLDGSNFVVGGGNARGSIPESTPTIGGTLKTIFKNMALAEKAANGTKSSLELKFEASASKSITFLFPEIVYERPEIGISGPAGVVVDFNYKAFLATAAEASSCVVTLVNDVATY